MPAMPPPRQRVGAALALSWLASLTVLWGGATAAWLYRAELVEFWPPLGRLVLWLGA